jgi:hypothetical protein
VNSALGNEVSCTWSEFNNRVLFTTLITAKLGNIHNFRQTKMATTDPVKFIQQVLNEINGTVLPTKALAAERKVAARTARDAAACGADALTVAMIRDGVIQVGMWRDYFVGERRDLGLLFRDLAERGTLTTADWAEQVENFTRGRPRMVVVHTKGTPPVIDPVPRFERKDVALEAKIAFCLLWLAEQRQTDLGVRVQQCLHCDKLFLSKPSLGRGRPRGAYCCSAHGRLYRQVQYRKRAKAKAAKHK